jgi:predicted CxxxxCH...CXXCH cytochrome family protein
LRVAASRPLDFRRAGRRILVAEPGTWVASCIGVRRVACLMIAFVAACSDDRAPPATSGGAHPVGWGDKGSATFHADWLKANKFPLSSRCAQCHGDDFAGGAVGVACSQGSCHTQGSPTTCTTCHGSRGTPRPEEGAHWAHQAFCDTCHQVPVQTAKDVERHASGDATTLVRFSGLAVHNGATPSWDSNSQTCTGAYCHHGSQTPQWTTTTQIQCNGCHDAPPSNHARWARLATTPDTCKTCHPGSDDPRHINGTVDITVSACTTCHGSNGHPNPPTALDGSSDPTTRGVGAHERHLNGALPDRISKPLACATCHVVPASVLDPGHIDQPTTQVRFNFGGSYDATATTCNVWCHWNKTSGPVWTNASGSARQCGSCHEFPPVKTRAGTPHPSVAADVNVCRECHVFDPSTHVDGVVDFRTQ